MVWARRNLPQGEIVLFNMKLLPNRLKIESLRAAMLVLLVLAVAACGTASAPTPLPATAATGAAQEAPDGAVAPAGTPSASPEEAAAVVPSTTTEATSATEAPAVAEVSAPTSTAPVTMTVEASGEASAGPAPADALVSELGNEAWNFLVQLTEEFSPRASATDEEKAAADFLAARFEELGLKTTIQPFTVELLSNDPPIFSLDASEQHEIHTISKIAELIDAQDSDVTDLLQEGRLGGALLSILRKKGVAPTPAVKNSVQRLLRTLEAGQRSPADAASNGVPDQGTSTIMFTDMVDSSSMIQRLGDREGKLVLGVHEEIVRSAAAQRDGAILKSLGDGFMLVFHSVRCAVACAIAVQRALADYNSSPENACVSVRIGIAVGEPVRDGEDLFGLSVVTAARIASQAKGGQVLVSEIGKTLASSSGEFEFLAAGSTKLKGIAGNHKLFEVAWAEEH